jgi:integrase
VLRGWQRDLDAYVLGDLGSYRLSEIELDVQQLVNRLAAKGLSPSRVRNILNPVRAIYRRAVKFERLQVNPTTGLEFAAMPDLVKRAAEPTELHDLLGALAEAYGTSRHGRELDDRARWATAAYAGLRLGELRAPRWSDVELRSGEGAHAGWISVTQAWDNVAGAVLPKSKAGKRRVPIVRPYLADELQALRERTERSGDDFVFGQTATTPFCTNVEQRVKNALARVNKERAKRKLDPVAYFGLHAMRHTFGALCRAAGIAEADTSEYLGHSRQGITARYTSPIDVDAAALDNMERLAALIARGDTEARLAQLDAEFEPVGVPLLAEQVRQAFADDPEGFERFLDELLEDGGERAR